VFLLVSLDVLKASRNVGLHKDVELYVQMGQVFSLTGNKLFCLKSFLLKWVCRETLRLTASPNYVEVHRS
jgi:hypothetical protein